MPHSVKSLLGTRTLPAPLHHIGFGADVNRGEVVVTLLPFELCD